MTLDVFQPVRSIVLSILHSENKERIFVTFETFKFLPSKDVIIQQFVVVSVLDPNQYAIDFRLV